MVVEAIVAAVLREHVGDVTPDLIAARARFVREQRARMPDYLALPMSILTGVFNLWPLPTRGRTFRHLDAAGQRAQIHAWKTSRLGVRRDFIRFHEGLVLYDLLDERCG